MVEEAGPSIPTGKRRLSPRGRQAVVQVVVGMVILICGVIIGSGAAVLVYKKKLQPSPGGGPLPPIEAVISDMKARYDLTEEQAKKVETTFSKRRETLRTLFDEFRTKSEAEFKKLTADIKKILTPEQFVHWEQDFNRRRRPGPRRDRGPGGPGDRGFGPRGPDDRRPGDWGPEDRGPGKGFGDRGMRGFHDRPGRDFRDRNRGPWDPNAPDPNIPIYDPNIPAPDPNAPEP
ncbi:MAG: hypothetical protein JXM79_24920 [Sedimentisphaerales bacterium]|nr:hypothetical protein [Sedimentisphaerales bacterium]